MEKDIILKFVFIPLDKLAKNSSLKGIQLQVFKPIKSK